MARITTHDWDFTEHALTTGAAAWYDDGVYGPYIGTTVHIRPDTTYKGGTLSIDGSNNLKFVWNMATGPNLNGQHGFYFGKLPQIHPASYPDYTIRYRCTATDTELFLQLDDTSDTAITLATDGAWHSLATADILNVWRGKSMFEGAYGGLLRSTPPADLDLKAIGFKINDVNNYPPYPVGYTSYGTLEVEYFSITAEDTNANLNTVQQAIGTSYGVPTTTYATPTTLTVQGVVGEHVNWRITLEDSDTMTSQTPVCSQGSVDMKWVRGSSDSVLVNDPTWTTGTSDNATIQAISIPASDTRALFMSYDMPSGDEDVTVTLNGVVFTCELRPSVLTLDTTPSCQLAGYNSLDPSLLDTAVAAWFSTHNIPRGDININPSPGISTLQEDAIGAEPYYSAHCTGYTGAVYDGGLFAYPIDQFHKISKPLRYHRLKVGEFPGDAFRGRASDCGTRLAARYPNADFYHVLKDEAGGDELLAQGPIWEIIRDAGMKNFAALHSYELDETIDPLTVYPGEELWDHWQGTYGDTPWDLLDAFVCTERNLWFAKRCRDAGKRYGTYGYWFTDYQPTDDAYAVHRYEYWRAYLANAHEYRNYSPNAASNSPNYYWFEPDASGTLIETCLVKGLLRARWDMRYMATLERLLSELASWESHADYIAAKAFVDGINLIDDFVPTAIAHIEALAALSSDTLWAAPGSLTEFGPAGIPGMMRPLPAVVSIGVAGLLHAHSIDTVTLEGIEGSVVVADSTHAHTVDTLTLVQQHTLVVESLDHTLIDGAPLTLVEDTGSLVVTAIDHVHTIDTVTLVYNDLLVVGALTHAHTIDTISVSEFTGTLTVEALTHAHSIDTVTFYTLTLTDFTAMGIPGHYRMGITTPAAQTIATLDATHAHTIDTITISYNVFLHVLTDPWTITNITATRTLDKTTATLRGLADLVGTMVYDYVNGWDGTLYNVTGGSSITEIDGDTATSDDLFDWAHTLIEDNPSSWIDGEAVTVSNILADYIMACTAVNGANEIAGVLAALRGAWVDPHCTISGDVTLPASWVGSCGTDLTLTANSMSTDVTLTGNTLDTDVGIGCGNQ